MNFILNLIFFILTKSVPKIRSIQKIMFLSVVYGKINSCFDKKQYFCRQKISEK